MSEPQIKSYLNVLLAVQLMQHHYFCCSVTAPTIPLKFKVVPDKKKAQ